MNEQEENLVRQASTRAKPHQISLAEVLNYSTENEPGSELHPGEASAETGLEPDMAEARPSFWRPYRNRGNLKIFLGAAAGVGKTFAMLEEARDLKTQGMDVVIGYVELHGRKE